MQIVSLLLVNRLLTRVCRMQNYSMKDLLISQEQIIDLDRAWTQKKSSMKRGRQRTDIKKAHPGQK
jgi:hypothetical protein